MPKFGWDNKWSRKALRKRFRDGLKLGIWPYVDIQIYVLGITLFAVLWDGHEFELCLFNFWFWISRR